MSRVLLSVPPHLRDFMRSDTGRGLWSSRLTEIAGGADVFVGADPLERRLGSGGGTINLLAQAWSERPRSRRGPLFDWLRADQKLVLHGGGESRRLPSYASMGKIFLPMPAVEGLAPRRFDQMLADFQIPAYQQVLREAGKKAAVLVTAGDVWLDFDPLQIPAVTSDITGIGMRVRSGGRPEFWRLLRREGKRPCRGSRAPDLVLPPEARVGGNPPPVGPV